MFEWKPEYAVNVAKIDSQHQGLFEICRELHAAMAAGQGKAVLGPLLDNLVQYTVSHFSYEESLLLSHGYPALADHKAMHAALTKQVRAFQGEFVAGRTAMAVEVAQFLSSWLAKHIRSADFAYAPHLKSRKVA